jgi:acetyl esterase/lipase
MISRPRGPVAWIRLCAALAALGPAVRLGADPVRIWPGAAPGDKGGLGKEADTTKADGALIAGRPVVRLGNVSDPTIEVFRAPAATNTGTAVLVCPGGGFYILAMDLEGTEVCEWLNSVGVTGVLLKYRVPRREGRAPLAAPLEDAQRAMGIVRSHAREWGIDPARIGALGFSAGGELVAALSAGSGSRSYPRVDASDDVSCLPDFQVLVYPGYLGPVNGSTPNPDVAVTGRTPPTFMVVAADDPVVPPDSVIGYAAELSKAKVPVEFHLYPTGGHGFGLRPTKDMVTTWPQRAADWMRTRGLLGAAPGSRP